jgi:hypothetical protein
LLRDPGGPRATSQNRVLVEHDLPKAGSRFSAAPAWRLPIEPLLLKDSFQI